MAGGTALVAFFYPTVQVVIFTQWSKCPWVQSLPPPDCPNILTCGTFPLPPAEVISDFHLRFFAFIAQKS